MSDFADRNVTLTDPLAALDEAIAEAARLLRAADAVAEPAAPGEWSFDQLRRHFVEILDEYAAVADGQPATTPGSDFVAAFDQAADRARKAFHHPGFLDGNLDTPLGPQPGKVLVQHVVNELVSHSWDLARCIGRPAQLPDDLAERCQRSWTVFFETHGRPDCNFAPERVPPPDASGLDKLAAYLGRDV